MLKYVHAVWAVSGTRTAIWEDKPECGTVSCLPMNCLHSGKPAFFSIHTLVHMGQQWPLLYSPFLPMPYFPLNGWPEISVMMLLPLPSPSHFWYSTSFPRKQAQGRSYDLRLYWEEECQGFKSEEKEVRQRRKKSNLNTVYSGLTTASQEPLAWWRGTSPRQAAWSSLLFPTSHWLKLALWDQYTPQMCYPAVSFTLLFFNAGLPLCCKTIRPSELIHSAHFGVFRDSKVTEGGGGGGRWNNFNNQLLKIFTPSKTFT